MKVLGFDTATRATSVAVLDTDTEAVHERRDDPPSGARPRHTTHLLPLAAQALADAQTDWSGLGLIAVGAGPGTFTGIRIGIATARALAAARSVPIASVSTLQALASGASGTVSDHERVLAVLDARRREVFVAGWEPGAIGSPGGEPLLTARAIAPATLAETLAASEVSWLAIGDGVIAYRAAVEEAGARAPADDSPLHMVSAAEICRLALTAPAGMADDIHPDYLREPDAQLASRRGQTG